MNPTPENETEAIRSDIDTTRRRMDDTMDAIGDRLKGPHLVDEVLGFFRSDTGRGAELREKVSQSARTASHAVVDTVKSHPVPALLIGAGVAWLIYNSRRDRSPDANYESDDYYSGGNYPDPDTGYDRPLEYPSSATVQSGSSSLSGSFGSEVPNYGYGAASSGDAGTGVGGKLSQATEQLKEKASAAGQQAKQTFANVGASVREKTGALTDQAREFGSRVSYRVRETYEHGRERVVATAYNRPLELGLVSLAAGVVAGLLLPTPERVKRLAGPQVDRLRARARETGSELLHKGERVARAAAEAVKSEAEAQGLTSGALREKAGAVAQHGKDAAMESARQEGVLPADQPKSPGGAANPGSGSGQPSA